jgi:hypothetical protein
VEGSEPFTPGITPSMGCRVAVSPPCPLLTEASPLRTFPQGLLSLPCETQLECLLKDVTLMPMVTSTSRFHKQCCSLMSSCLIFSKAFLSAICVDLLAHCVLAWLVGTSWLWSWPVWVQLKWELNTLFCLSPGSGPHLVKHRSHSLCVPSSPYLHSRCHTCWVKPVLHFLALACPMQLEGAREDSWP